MKRTIIAVLLCCTATASPTHAADASATDTELNTTYKALLPKLDAADQQRLRDAQRAWISFRDKECRFRAQGTDDGLSSATTSSLCLTELTQQRTDALKRQLDCPEGDITCVPRTRDTAAASAAADVACSRSAGQAKAELYVQQCQQVSPATHPPCNVANPCELITGEIERGCTMIDKDAPAFCASYGKNRQQP